ncbi:MAG: hypothetical protein ISS31_06905 [Kiritimatiellae bacterium]|nr:hypothetical protein [Kiritimatiellia bacterium]
MKTRIIVAVMMALCLQVVAAEKPAIRPKSKQKAALKTLLDSLKTKGKQTRKTRHILSLPVASAGARGGEVRTANRFALLWPEGSHISPLTALSVNLEAAGGGSTAGADMRTQLTDFVEVFPEFRKEPLLEDLNVLLTHLDRP